MDVCGLVADPHPKPSPSWGDLPVVASCLPLPMDAGSPGWTAQVPPPGALITEGAAGKSRTAEELPG